MEQTPNEAFQFGWKGGGLPLYAPAPRGRAFKMTAGGVVLAGVVAFGVLCYAVKKKPETVVVRAPAPPPPPPIIIREPAPAPVVLPAPIARIESRPEPVIPIPRAEPPPPPVGAFDGAWLVVGRPLPAFTLQNTGSATKGTYAPANVTGQYPFTAGAVVNDALEFSVTDQLGQRVFFAMKFESSIQAKVWIWRRAEDVLADMTRLARRADLAPAQRQAMQIALQRELQLAGKRIPIGTFRRAKDGSEEPK